VKKIECVVRPMRLHAVKTALAEAGITGMTVTDVRGTGRGGGVADTLGGMAYVAALPPKVKIEIVASDDDVETVIHLVLEHARTGEPGDGKIFVLPAHNALRIRTGDTGEAVL
jgi:nitrogen regulatory protein P-II 1